MIRLPLVRRSDDDDYAPIDYSFVGSLAEGQHQKEAPPNHQSPMDPVIRHQADPNERGIVDGYGTRARRSSVVRKPSNSPMRRGLPSLTDGPVPVERVPHPQEILPTLPKPAKPEIFDPPVQPQIPEWLRVAQQNNAAQDDRRVRHPQITTAPNQPEPQGNLLGEPAYWARHGSGGSAAPPPPLAYYDTAPGLPCVDGPYAEAKPIRTIPWLGIIGLILALLAMGLWLMGMSFANQKNLLLVRQEEEAEAIRNSHPYRYRQLIETQAQIHNLHPAYIAAIVLNESSFNPRAESRVGARGLMQMMPDTAEWVHGKIGQGQPYSFDSMYDPDMNVRYACWYLNFLSGRFQGDPVLVASAFHAGQNTVQNWLNDSRYSADNRTIALKDMPDGPTKNYTTRVMQAYAVYKHLYYEDPIYGG